MTDFEVTGRCLCGAVVYRVTAPAKRLEHCHCTYCRHAHGALYASGALVDAAHFHIDRGSEHLKAFTSTPGNHRWFCGGCGCHIYMSVDDIPSEIYYWAASLDADMHPGHPENCEWHLFVGSKASWDRFDQSLPTHDAYADRPRPDDDG